MNNHLDEGVFTTGHKTESGSAIIRNDGEFF